MNKNTVITALFIAIETVIYITFLVTQLTTDTDPVAVKYAGILVCLAYAAVICISRKKDSLYLLTAMVFTAISDLFIFVIDDFYEIGVTTFILAQIAYFLRIYHLLGKKPVLSAAIRAGVAIILIIVLGVLNALMPLTFLVAIYFTMLVGNAAESARLWGFSKRYIAFFIGLILFIGCDICVGLNNFYLLGAELPAWLDDFVTVAMWGFYLPSQVLISLSFNTKKKQ